MSHPNHQHTCYPAHMTQANVLNKISLNLNVIHFDHKVNFKNLLTSNTDTLSDVTLFI